MVVYRMNIKKSIPNDNKIITGYQEELRHTWKLYHIEDNPQDYPLQWDGERETGRGMHGGIDK